MARVARIAREIGIWVTGLLASAIIGAGVAARLQPSFSYGWSEMGMLAGILVFACVRLWSLPYQK